MYSRAAAFALLACSAFAAEVAPMRPPAVPLIVHDPYFSIWSMADELTAKNTSHWSGIDQPITGLLRIDGKVRRFIGGTALGRHRCHAPGEPPSHSDLDRLRL